LRRCGLVDSGGMACAATNDNASATRINNAQAQPPSRWTRAGSARYKRGFLATCAYVHEDYSLLLRSFRTSSPAKYGALFEIARSARTAHPGDISSNYICGTSTSRLSIFMSSAAKNDEFWWPPLGRHGTRLLRRTARWPSVGLVDAPRWRFGGLVLRCSITGTRAINLLP